MLCKPSQSNKANLEGVKYVTARMEWYCALSDHILDDKSLKLEGEAAKRLINLLRDKLVSLYQKLLLFLMQSVCSYYRHQGVVFLKSLVGLDEWETSLTIIKSLEGELSADLDRFVKAQDNIALQEIDSRAAKTMQILGDINQTIASYFTEQKLDKKAEEDSRLLKMLCVLDTKDDMDAIEKRKDDLLEDSFRWILGVPEFQEFAGDAGNADDDSNNDTFEPCRLLWIKGNAGTGKTMLLIGIIRELSARPACLCPSVAHFFFQNKDGRLNSCMAALRSLLWMLLLQQPDLLTHLRTKYANSKPRFEGDTDRVGLIKVFEAVLSDPRLRSVYFIVDALDECDQDLPEFISVISKSLTLTDKVKWLVSSRPTVPVEKITPALVELNSSMLEAPVQAYINHQLSRLKGEDGYTSAIIDEMYNKILDRAQNTYLWVWFVFQKLSKPDKRGHLPDGVHALRIIQKFPPGLSDLYHRIIDMIKESDEDDWELCKATLQSVFLAFQPLSLDELAAMMGVRTREATRIIKECCSLLTVADNTVNLVHQSANDFFAREFSRLFSVSIAQGHADLAQRCLRSLSGLHKNMYKLEHIGSSRPVHAQVPQPDPLRAMRYSSIYWVRHLSNSDYHCVIQINDMIMSFLQLHAFHWIESVALLDSLGKCEYYIEQLSSLLHVCWQFLFSDYTILGDRSDCCRVYGNRNTAHTRSSKNLFPIRSSLCLQKISTSGFALFRPMCPPYCSARQLTV